MDAAKEWPKILSFNTGATINEELVEENYRKLAKKYHPDAGGSTDDMQQLNAAKQLALQWIKNERSRQEQAKRIQEQLNRIASQQAYAQQAMQQQFMNQMNGYLGSFGAQAASQQWANAYSPASESPKPPEVSPKPEPNKGWLNRLAEFVKQAW